jgi:hypothetical protein
MVLSKEELISTLQNEVRILVHLASKVDPSKADYRPSAKQRSIIELLHYLVVMGPNIIRSIKAGAFDGEAWGAAAAAANALNLNETVAALEKQSATYAELLNSYSDSDFREKAEFFGSNQSKGAHIVYLVAGGHAAYRTQLFLYLKSCGRDELNTMNLWGGMDAPMG